MYYKKIDASKELPNESENWFKDYFTVLNKSGYAISARFNPITKKWHCNSDFLPVKYWLKEVELISEEEIEKMALKRHPVMGSKNVNPDVLAGHRNTFINGAKAILKKLNQ